MTRHAPRSTSSRRCMPRSRCGPSAGHPGRARQLSRPTSTSPRAWRRRAPGIELRLAADSADLAAMIDERHRRRADQPCRLPHRRVARHGGLTAARTPRRPRRLGPLPQRRRRADRARRARRRLRRRLHLQVPERRPGRAGLHLRRSRGTTTARPAAVRLVGACARPSPWRAAIARPPASARLLCGTQPILSLRALEGGARCAGRHRSRG